MSGIYFLNHADFEIEKGDRGDMMTLKYDKNGLTLVLFYSKELPSCDYLMTKFKQLPALMNGCNFAMVNMNKNMELVEISRNTIAPISYVPDLTLFVNGCPFIRYDGPQEIENICGFLKDIYEKIHKLQFTKGSGSSGSPQTVPPATAAPIPVSTTSTAPPQAKVPAPSSLSSYPIPQQGLNSVRPEDVEFNNRIHDPVTQMNSTSDVFQKQNYHIRNPSTTGGSDGQKNQFYNERVQPAIPPGLQNLHQNKDTLQSTSVVPVPAYTIGIPKSGKSGKMGYMSFTDAYTSST